MELVGVVRDQDDVGGRVRRPSGPANRRSNPGASGPRRSGKHAPPPSGAWRRGTRATGRSWRRGRASRCYEDPAVDGGQVDRVLDAVGKSVEGADHVVTVQAEVEREMVPRPRRHHDVGEAVAGRHRGDQRLGAVAAGHAQDVGAPGDGVLGQASRSSPGPRTIGSIPRFRHSSTRWNRSAFPPPDFRFMISAGWLRRGSWPCASRADRAGRPLVLAQCDDEPQPTDDERQAARWQRSGRRSGPPRQARRPGSPNPTTASAGRDESEGPSPGEPSHDPSDGHDQPGERSRGLPRGWRRAPTTRTTTRRPTTPGR